MRESANMQFGSDDDEEEDEDDDEDESDDEEDDDDDDTEEFLEVKIFGVDFAVGDIVEVKAVSHDGIFLNCELIERVTK